MENNIENEVWRDVDGYDGMYQVSDLGRVRSKKYGNWRVMRSKKINSGYLIVDLCKGGNVKSFLVHRLVASYFVQNSNILNNEINHINEDKTDNRASNLEWCDRRYNMNYNGLLSRCITKRDNYIRPKIDKLYNPDLSIQKNLEIFRANGIECCEKTVRNLRKDLGLTRKYTKRS